MALAAAIQDAADGHGDGGCPEGGKEWISQAAPPRREWTERRLALASLSQLPGPTNVAFRNLEADIRCCSQHPAKVAGIMACCCLSCEQASSKHGRGIRACHPCHVPLHMISALFARTKLGTNHL